MENLGIDTKLLVAQLINFLLFLYVFKRFIAGPFLKFVHSEKKKDEERQKMMSEIKKIEDNLSTMEADARKKAKHEADILIDAAKHDAEKVRRDMVEQAQKDAEGIVEKTKKQLEEERQGLYKEVKATAAKLSTVMIDKALDNYLTEDAQKQMTEHILSRVSQEE